MYHKIVVCVFKKAAIGLSLSVVGYGGLLVYDFLLGLRVGQEGRAIGTSVALTLIWVLGAAASLRARQWALALSLLVSWFLLILTLNLRHEVYLRGLSRAARAPGFVDQLSAWAYSAPFGRVDEVFVKADELPGFLYDWIGRPRANQPGGCLRIINAFKGQPRPPRSFELGSIGFSFVYKPYGTATEEIREGVYLYTP